jgi:plastocyanin
MHRRFLPGPMLRENRTMIHPGFRRLSRTERMKVVKIRHWIPIAGLLAMGTACTKAPPPPQAPELLRTATIKDIMDSMVDPSGDFLFQSVQEISDEHGVTEKAPKTDAEWEEVRHHVFILLEAPNLLTMEGRKVARPEDKSKAPGIENEPEEVRKLLDADRPSFIRRARRLQDAAMLAMKAVDAKDKDALFRALDSIDKACENCHLHYWYPNDKRAQEAAKEDGITETEGEPPARVPATLVDRAAGAVTGRVIFQGDAPEMPVFDMSSNPSCARQHPAPQKAETVVVNRNGTLRNVFIWIKDGLPPARWTPPAEAARLDQTGCVYEPHVLGIMQGQQLEILNGDPVNHNVHMESRTNPAWDESQPPHAGPKYRQFKSAEVMFPVGCSVHPWMRSYIAVSPHPFFAVTGDDGSFALKGVPPGSYTIEAVHEKYGRKEGRVTVAANGKATLDFIYTP